MTRRLLARRDARIYLAGQSLSALQTLAQGLRLITPLLGAGLLAWLGPVPVIIGDVASGPPAADTGGNQQSSAGIGTMQPGVR